MVTSMVVTSAKTEDQIFELLKRTGPLCMSQIAVDLGISLKSVRVALDALNRERLVEPRPDKDRKLAYDEQEVPWGLSRPAFANRSR